MSTIGFIGIGAIGLPMARRLLDAGFEVMACDPNPEALAHFAASGGQTTHSPGDCAAQECIVFMVADDSQLEAGIHGPDGVLSRIGSQRPALFIVMSTVQPDTVRELAATVAPLGIRVIDAPVSGGPVAAAAGQLSIMVGGNEADVQAAQPVLAALGTTIHHCGALGHGELTKVVNNLVGVTTLMLLAEGLQLAHAHGLDLSHLSGVMEVSSGRHAGSADWQRMRAVFDEFSSDLPRVSSFLRINAKDMKLALALGERAGIDMPLLQSALTATQAMSVQEMRERMRSFL